MDEEIGRAALSCDRETRDGRIRSNHQACGAVQRTNGQVLMLFGPPSFAVPSIERVAVIAATDPNTRSAGWRYGRRLRDSLTSGRSFCSGMSGVQ